MRIHIKVLCLFILPTIIPICDVKQRALINVFRYRQLKLKLKQLLNVVIKVAGLVCRHHRDYCVSSESASGRCWLKGIGV